MAMFSASAVAKLLTSLNRKVAYSAVGKYFKLEGSGAVRERAGTRFTTELRAGLATFVTMAYIMAVNATIISDSGGTCGCKELGGPAVCMKDPVYLECLREVKQDLVVATAAISAIATFFMGFLANLPLAIAPGLGLNAYFTYQVVGFQGSGNVSYQTALAAVFIEGVIFVVLSAVGLRQLITKFIPMSIKTASAAGIGLFLTFIGLQSSAGIGLVVGESSTLVTLGACPADLKDEMGHCKSGTMESPTTWVGILGFMIIALLMAFRVKGSILIGILFVSGISWFRNTSITYFPDTVQGNQMYEDFKSVVSVPRIKHTAGALDFNLNTGEVWVALITFLYVDILDTTGTMFTMANYAGFMDENGDFEGSYAAFLTDATSCMIGAALGSSPVTAFIESGAGLAEGGRTGLTAITTSFFFILSLFFSPIFAAFPPWATGPALLVIGVLMAQTTIMNINWKYLPDAIPAFLTIAIMPLTYSISHGLIAGLGSYIAINGTLLILKKVSGGRLVPPDVENKEDWGPKEPKDIYPFWLSYFMERYGATEKKRQNMPVGGFDDDTMHVDEEKGGAEDNKPV
ncbi:hypothetical protein PhCBS80983_g04364 [Powellomyces hirtus]|uniref:Xanthine/uracil/vitamin C permease n=1 Tax=Powellomyces hirtus TaxID=109895 RepID=A0A507E0A8_9FUNG|nr:hypothetical protein PhCBS80983_g04364 [Powellomyces hirtus]